MNFDRMHMGKMKPASLRAALLACTVPVSRCSADCASGCRRPDNSGQALIGTAIFLVVLFGLVGLAADAGYMFHYRRTMQVAADSAAIAGALQLHNGATDWDSVATADAARNNFQKGTNGIDVSVNSPPMTGFFAGQAGYVEAIIRQSRPTLFMGVLGTTSGVVGARAVAGPRSSGGCLYTLNETAAKAITLSGSASLNVPDCAIVDNSNNADALDISGSASITASGVEITGGYRDASSGSISPTPDTGVPRSPDPLGGLAAPSSSGLPLQGTNLHLNSGNGTLNPGLYDGGITISGAHVTFNPGLYYIDGTGLVMSGGSSSMQGDGVTFYVTGNGKFNISGGGTADLSAPATGDMTGILFFQDRADTQSATVSGGSTIGLEGALYFPNAHLDFSGGSSGSTTTPYTLIVADTVTFSGPSFLNANFGGLPGGSPLKQVALAE